MHPAGLSREVHGGLQNKMMATTLARCWYCSGLIGRFQTGKVVVGESLNFHRGIDWLREHGIRAIDLQDEVCIVMMQALLAKNRSYGRRIGVNEVDEGESPRRAIGIRQRANR